MNSAIHPESPLDLMTRPAQVREEESSTDPSRRRLWQHLLTLRRSRERRAQAALAIARQITAQRATACAAVEAEHQRNQQVLAVERLAVMQSRIGLAMPRSEFEKIAIEYRRLDARFAASANQVAESRQALMDAETRVAPCMEQYRGAARASERVAEALRREPDDEC